MQSTIFRKLFHAIRAIEAFVLSTAMLALAALTIVNVFARTLFNHSLNYIEEINQFLIVVICFVGLSYGASMGRHIRMSAFCDLLPRRPRKALMIAINATTAGLLAALAIFAARYAMSVSSHSPVLGVPMAWVYWIAPVGLGLAAVQFALTTVRNLTAHDVYISYDKKDEYAEPIDF